MKAQIPGNVRFLILAAFACLLLSSAAPRVTHAAPPAQTRSEVCGWLPTSADLGKLSTGGISGNCVAEYDFAYSGGHRVIQFILSGDRVIDSAKKEFGYYKSWYPGIGGGSLGDEGIDGFEEIIDGNTKTGIGRLILHFRRGTCVVHLSSSIRSDQPPLVAQARKIAAAIDASITKGCQPYQFTAQPTPTTPITEATVCQAPPRITAQQIDAYLDFLAAQLQFAVEKAETYTFEPFVMDARPFRFTPKDAADLGRAVWDQAHALQKKHVERELTLNDAQKKRTKAFGHWADWLERRAKTQKKTFRGEVIEVYEQPEKPPYPLFGPITQDVPTPPQLKGEDIFVVNVPWWGPEAITDDYAWAGFWTVAQGADMWYTRGLFWTTYVALSHESIAPVALAALQRIPYFGPTFTAAFVSAVELNSWTEIGILRKYLGEAPLSWDQHLANYASLTNLGIAAALRTFPSLNKVSLWAGGLDEGKIGPDITAKFGEGKSFRVTSERTDAQGNQYQKIEYALLGPTKANPNNQLSFPTDEFRVVNTKEGARYFTVKANGELDQPVFFLGQKGYHTWKHLTEINAGQKTKYEDESLLNVFAGKKDYLAELKAIEKTMLDPTQSLDAANKQYIAFTNRLIADKSFTRVSGFYQWKNRDGSLAPAEANFFIMVPKDCGANAPVATFPVRVSVDPTNGRLMGLFVLKAHDPTAAFMPEAKISVAPSAYWAWARDVDKYLYEFAPLRNYMPAR